MGRFILNKEDGVHQLLISTSFESVNEVDGDVHKSNLPFRVVKNKYGKILVACDSIPIYSQVILTNLSLFDKNEHIDFDYLNNIYYKKLDSLLGRIPFVPNRLGYVVVVVAEGKSYELFEDGAIKESDLLCSDASLAITYNGNCDLYDKHDKKFLVKTFEMCLAKDNERQMPLCYIDTKTFKLALIKGAKR
ncbi:MAG: hypothetical protein MJ228_04180 [Bacilli bacterium]|nr:hypothetical protein [Bacilli bacterium]